MSVELSCPYNGKTVRVLCNYTGPGPSIYYQTGAWSPSRTFKDVGEARRQMLRRGPKWLEDTGEVLKCPYTGAKVSFIEVPGGVRPVGMYDPDRSYEDSEAIYYALAMREGKPAEGTRPKKEPIKPIEVRYFEDREPFEVTQERESKSRAKSDTFEMLKEAAAPEVAKVLARKKK